MKNFINELFGPDVFHVHFERRLHKRWHAQPDTVLLVKLALDRVIHQRSQAGCNDDTRAVSQTSSCGQSMLDLLCNIGESAEDALIADPHQARRYPAAFVFLFL